MRREGWKFFALVVLLCVACIADGDCSVRAGYDGHEAGCNGPGGTGP